MMSSISGIEPDTPGFDFAGLVGGGGMSSYLAVSLVFDVVVVVALVPAYRFQCEWGAMSVRRCGLGGGKKSVFEAQTAKTNYGLTGSMDDSCTERVNEGEEL